MNIAHRTSKNPAVFAFNHFFLGLCSVLLSGCIILFDDSNDPPHVRSSDKRVVMEIFELNGISEDFFWDVVGVKNARIADLNLTQRGIDTLPPSIGELNGLELLDLSSNSITHIPEELGNAEELQRLDLSYNNLRTPPNFVTSLHNLVEYDISQNEMCKVDLEGHMDSIELSNPELYSGRYGRQNCDYLLREDSLIVATILERLDNNSVTVKDITRNRDNRIYFLDLTGLGLDEIPEKVFELNALNHLILDSNSISQIPVGIAFLDSLKYLDLNANQLAQVTTALLAIPTLIQFRAADNQIESITSQIVNHDRLTIVEFKGNKLCDIDRDVVIWIYRENQSSNWEESQDCPDGTPLAKDSAVVREILDSNQLSDLSVSEVASFQYGRATRLDFRYHKLSTIPASIGTLSELTHLNSRLNGLDSLPSALGSLIQLEQIVFENGSLRFLPGNIGNLAALRVLTLSKNRLVELPVGITQLTKLRELHLHNNELTAIPSDIGELDSLIEFTLDNNSLEALPSSISQLQKIDHLKINHNNLSEIPESIIGMDSLTRISVHSNRLSALPVGIGTMTNLEHINADSNLLSDIPLASLSSSDRLQAITLRGNRLCDLSQETQDWLHNFSTYQSQKDWGPYQICSEHTPIHNDTLIIRAMLDSAGLDSLGTLKYLHFKGYRIESVYFSSLPLTDLPPGIGQLDELRKLTITNGQITHIPIEIGQLENLEYLSLFQNQLTDVPDEITQLTNLKELRLHTNQITGLPDDIGLLTNLTVLDVHENQLTTLPESIIQLEGLTSLNIKENMICDLPEDLRLWANQNDTFWDNFQNCN